MSEFKKGDLITNGDGRHWVITYIEKTDNDTHHECLQAEKLQGEIIEGQFRVWLDESEIQGYWDVNKSTNFNKLYDILNN